jgi:uncharacterized protein YidB (DUF937 family)
VLSGGLNDLIKQFQWRGKGEVADSWAGTGSNNPISPNDLASALELDRISLLTAQSGMSREESQSAQPKSATGDRSTYSRRTAADQRGGRALGLTST